jgi:hypothetical protein
MHSFFDGARARTREHSTGIVAFAPSANASHISNVETLAYCAYMINWNTICYRAAHSKRARNCS